MGHGLDVFSSNGEDEVCEMEFEQRVAGWVTDRELPRHTLAHTSPWS